MSLFFKLRVNRKLVWGAIMTSALIAAPFIASALPAVTTFARLDDRRAPTTYNVYQAVRSSEMLIAQLLGARVNLRNVEAPARGVFGELDVINGKLDRLNSVCAGGAGGTGAAVNADQTRQCINTCLVDNRDASSQRLNERLFVSCVSRCPSVDGNGVSCARRYMDWIDGYTPEALDRVSRLTTNSSADLETIRLLRRALPVVQQALSACLVNADANACQSNCEGTSSIIEWRTCLGRCSNIVEPIQIPTSAGILQIPAAPRVPVPLDEPPVTGVTPPRSPTPAPPVKDTAVDTATGCVTSCGTSRIACMVAAQNSKMMDDCVASATACLQVCPVK